MGLILTETRRVGIADHAGDRAWWSRQEARFEVRRRQAMHHINEWVFNLKYADEFARLICELSDPKDEVEFRNAERIRKGWYDYTAGRVQRIKDRTEPFVWGMGLVGLVKVAERGPRELVEGMRLWQEGVRSTPWGPRLLGAGRVLGHAGVVFGMGLDGYLFWGNIRDRKYAEAVGNFGNFLGGGVTLYEAALVPKLLAAGKTAVAGKMAFGMSAAWPIALAVVVGWAGSWAIRKVGEEIAHRRVREGKRRVLPELYTAHFRHKDRADLARQALDRMSSGRG